MKALILLSALLTALPASATQSGGLIGPSAEFVLGQSTYTNASSNYTDSLGMSSPDGLVIDTTTGRMFVVDTGNKRVLIWNNGLTVTSGQVPDVIIGQPDANGSSAVTTQTGTKLPFSVAVSTGGILWLCDALNNRVLGYAPPFTNGMNATLVLGQSGFTTSNTTTSASGLANPIGIAADVAGNVWVSDNNNNRILEFVPPFSNNMNATLVLGQPDFTFKTAATTQAGMNFPYTLAFDANGVLFVGEQLNRRVLAFTPPFSNGMNATFVFGKADFTSTTNGTTASLFQGSVGGVAVDASGDLWVSEGGANRVLEFVPPFSNAMNASLVLGAADFTTGGAAVATATALKAPRGMGFDTAGNLWVVEASNHRVSKFLAPFTNGMSASVVLGQTDHTHNGINYTDGKGLNAPQSVAVDSTTGRAFVGDISNSRVLWWDSASALADGAAATGVLGGSDLFDYDGITGAPGIYRAQGMAVDGTSVWAADQTCQRVVRFTAPFTNGMNGDLFLGVTNPASCGGGSGAGNLASPGGVALSGSGVVWVADTSNNRISGFFPPLSNGMAASVVLGQPDFATTSAGTTQAKLSAPFSVALDASGNLWVADKNNRRVVRFDPPFSNGMNASLVLGQANFTSAVTAQTAAGMNAPQSLAVAPDGELWVLDTSGRRVLEFSPPFSNGMAATGVIGQTNFTNSNTGTNATQVQVPTGLAVDGSGKVWMTDANNNRVTRYPAHPSTTTSGLSVTTNGVSSITWNWSAVSGATSYRVFPASNPAAFIGSPTPTTFTRTALSTNTAYGLQVAMANSNGYGALTAAVTAYTLAASATGPYLLNVGYSSATVAWQLNANPAGTTFRVAFTKGGSALQTNTVTSTNTAFAGLDNGTTYTATITTINGDGVLASATTALTMVTAIPVPASAVTGAAATTLVLSQAQGDAMLTAPAAAFAAGTGLTLSCQNAPPAGSGSAGNALTATGVSVEVAVNSGAQPATGVTLTLTYRAADIGTADPSTLVIARYDDTTGKWVPLASTVDSVGRTVTAVTGHLSIFQIMAATPAATVSGVKAFPNPMRPALGHTSMTFTNLPASARLRIYTLVGEKVRELTSDASGTASWDGRNGSGSSAASGVYFVEADAPGGGKKVFKVIVQR